MHMRSGDVGLSDGNLNSLYPINDSCRQPHQKDMEKGRGSVDADTFAEDEELLTNPEPEKPHPPEEFDQARVRSEIDKNAKIFRRNPGEPKLTLELTMSGKTTKDSDIYDNSMRVVRATLGGQRK